MCHQTQTIILTNIDDLFSVTTEMIKHTELIVAGGVTSRGKFHQMLMCFDKTWRFADIGYKSSGDVVSVTLPANRTNYR